MNRPLVVVMAQAFKETFTAAQVADRIASGVESAGGAPLVLLGSDGGDGLLEALRSDLIGKDWYLVSDPLGRPVQAPVGWLDRSTAVIESRMACGLALLDPATRDPMRTSTRGVGELVNHAVGAGASSVVIGLGGSATMDGGTGMARAWGWEFRDAEGKVLPEGGGSLAEVVDVEVGRTPDAGLTGLADVENVLTGASGAKVYAEQKGASGADAEVLMRGLDTLVSSTERLGSRQFAAEKGAGAAGGMGFGLLCFGRASLMLGASWVLDRAGFDATLGEAALVITGEGSFDATSCSGKLTGEVLQRAGRAGVPTLILAPRAKDVPQGVAVESGGGNWSAKDLEERARRGTERALRLLAR
ncbi:MAG: glycerate kinase [Gemmatimonadota bacterium]|nr:MAG: glycerate kinase [Gemmatimonadota bacterium]